MTKINGKILIERDYVGEAPSYDNDLIGRACDVFFAKRGIRTLSFKEVMLNQARARMRSKARRRERE